MTREDAIETLKAFTKDSRKGPRNTEIICRCDDKGDIQFIARGSPPCVAALTAFAMYRSILALSEVLSAASADVEFQTNAQQMLHNWGYLKAMSMEND